MANLYTILFILSCALVFVIGHPEDPKLFEGKTQADFVRRPPVQRSGRSTGCQGCRFAFNSPIMPSFDLPSAQPHSPGDVTLNVGNPIVMASGDPIAHGCNSKDAAYLAPDGVWTKTYTNNKGHSKKLKDVFYTSGTNLKVRTIQKDSSNLEAILSGSQVRLDVTCNNNQESCVHFFINAPPKVDTCDQCDGLINRTEEDNDLLGLTNNHGFLEIFADNLPATLATMDPNASVLFFASGNGGAPRDGPSGTIEDYYNNHVMFGKFMGQSDLNSGVYNIEVSDDHVIQEIFFSFNHTAPFDAFLPGIAPTYKRCSFVFVGFFKWNRETGLLLQERIYWDQASVLKQLGLIDQEDKLPIVGGEWWAQKYTNPYGPPAFGAFFN